MFVLCYMFLTAFRDLRDNFSAEVWKSLGYADLPGIYTTTEIPVTFIVLIVMGSVILIRKNELALQINHLIVFAGMIMIGISNFLFQQEIINPIHWMILIGTGLYLGYVPFNCIFFDRLIAAFRYVGTVGFIMYVADSFGYLGSVGMIILKKTSFIHVKWLDIIISSGYFISIIGGLLILGSLMYFRRKHGKWHQNITS